MLKLSLAAVFCAGALVLTTTTEPARAGVGDPSAAFIASNAGPGEITSTRCKSNGFLEVIFSLGATIVSRVESGTPCTPGAASGGRGLSNDQEAAAEAALAARFASLRRDDEISDLAESVQEAIRNGVDPDDVAKDFFEGVAAFGDEDGNAPTDEQTESVRNALTSELRGLKAKLETAKAELSAAQQTQDVRLQGLGLRLKAAQQEYDVVVSRAEIAARTELTDAELAEFDAATDIARLEDAERVVININQLKSRLGRMVPGSYEYQRMQAQISSREQQLESLSLPTSTSTANVANQLSAARARQLLAAQNVQEAKTELSDKTYLRSQEVSAANLAVRSVESEINDLSIAVDTHQQTVNSLSAEIRSVETQLQALDSSYQLAGRAGSPLEALRQRGIDVWFNASLTAAEDRQNGRRQDVDQYRLVVGGQGWLTERWLVGLAIGYATSDADDRTGTGTSTEADSYLVSPYAAYRISESVLADVSASYAYTDLKNVRAGMATSDTNSQSFGVSLGFSVEERLNPWVSVNGRLGQSYSYSESDGYTDSLGIIVPTTDNETAVTKLSAGIDASPWQNWDLFGSLNANYNTIKPKAAIDRADVFGAIGAEHNFGGIKLRGTVGSTLLRNDYSDITAGIRVAAQL